MKMRTQLKAGKRMHNNNALRVRTSVTAGRFNPRSM